MAISEGIRFESEKNDEAQKKLKIKDNMAIARVAFLFPLWKARLPATTSITNRMLIPVKAVGRRPTRSMTNGAAIVPARVQHEAMMVNVNASATPNSVRKTVVYVVERITPDIWLREKKEPATIVRLRFSRLNICQNLTSD